jgi:hypothetical protein
LSHMRGADADVEQKLEFRIHWRGWDEEEHRTWEPEDHL